jgi:hypothetical protein
VKRSTQPAVVAHMKTLIAICLLLPACGADYVTQAQDTDATGGAFELGTGGDVGSAGAPSGGETSTGGAPLVDLPPHMWEQARTCFNPFTDTGAVMVSLCAALEPSTCYCAPACDDHTSTSREVTADRAAQCAAWGGHCAFGYDPEHPLCVPGTE